MSRDSSRPQSASSALDRDRRLVELWRSGDLDCGEELMSHYHGYFLSLCWRYRITNEEDQVDLYQELLIRLIRALPKLELKSSFAGYLRRVFHTAFRETRTSSQLAPIHDGIVHHGPDPDRVVRDEEIVAAIEECSERLNDRERDVFTSRVIKERDFAEIADTLRLSIGNLHVIYHRARSKMRECLDQKGFRV